MGYHTIVPAVVIKFYSICISITYNSDDGSLPEMIYTPPPPPHPTLAQPSTEKNSLLMIMYSNTLFLNCRFNYTHATHSSISNKAA